MLGGLSPALSEISTALAIDFIGQWPWWVITECFVLQCTGQQSIMLHDIDRKLAVTRKIYHFLPSYETCKIPAGWWLFASFKSPARLKARQDRSSLCWWSLQKCCSPTLQILNLFEYKAYYYLCRNIYMLGKHSPYLEIISELSHENDIVHFFMTIIQIV